MTNTDVLILGSGVTGLSAAWALGDRAVVLERESRPGGLVRTERCGDFWFDRVLHLLYFQDPETQRLVRDLMGSSLEPCSLEAWCETSRGTTRFPFQMNLRGLDLESRIRCIRDLAEVEFRAGTIRAKNFEEQLLATFGRSMCEIFLLPYNRKMWKRPLHTLASTGFTWNITSPDFESVLRGAFDPESSFRAYNSEGWYPRPPAGSAVRGMECLTVAMADRVSDLRLGCEVFSVDPAHRAVVVPRGDRTERMHYREALLSTIPLTRLLDRCEGAPPQLRDAVSSLRRNRVLSIAIGVRGPRPAQTGHWRYYADETLCFTRLVFLHRFDPLLSPEDGWPLLVEITEPAEQPRLDEKALLARVRADLERAHVLPPASAIVQERVFEADPGYVVFDLESRPIVDTAHRYLAERGITSLGRFGKWEYSSMSSCIHDGRCWARTLDTDRAAVESVA